MKPDLEDLTIKVLGRAGAICLQANVDMSKQRIINIIRSVKTGNYAIFKAPNDDKVGFAVWARIDRHTLTQMKTRGYSLKYDHEWDEGSIIYMLDVVISPHWRGHLREFLREGVGSCSVIVTNRLKRTGNGAGVGSNIRVYYRRRRATRKPQEKSGPVGVERAASDQDDFNGARSLFCHETTEVSYE